MIKFLNLGAFLFMIIINGMATLGKLGGTTTAEVSEAYKNVFTPAGWTFSIWGAIYLLLMIFIAASFFNAAARDLTERIGYWFLISCVFNILWIFTWHFGAIKISMAMMIGLLISLIVIAGKTGSHISLVSSGFSLYLGWISVAMIANLVVTLVSSGIDGMGSGMQTLVTAVIPAAAIIIAAVVILREDYVYGAAGIFAYTGILFKHISSGGFDGKYSGIIAAALIGELIIVTATIYCIIGTLPKFERISLTK